MIFNEVFHLSASTIDVLVDNGSDTFDRFLTSQNSKFL